MSPFEKKYKKEYAYELLRIAEGDLNSARVLATATLGRRENAIYLCQQAIEKALKSVHCFERQRILHTHDVEALVQSLPEDKRPPESHQLGTLTQYATIRRYEEGYEQIEEADLRAVIALAESVLSWARSLMGEVPGKT